MSRRSGEGSGSADGSAGGFDAMTGAPPPGIRTTGLPSPSATRLVLIRHGEAVCNVTGVCGGATGCRGLTPTGEEQVRALRGLLTTAGTVRDATALYASTLPRAIETARLLAPAIAAGDPSQVRTDCGLCELHPGEADGMTWSEFGERFRIPDWDVDPHLPIAPGGESWIGFVIRVASTLERLADEHAGGTVVIATHAGVVEASLLAFLPIERGRSGARLGLKTGHATYTTWEVDGDRWTLRDYNVGVTG